MPTVTLLTKPGCHLCDEARPVVERVVAEHPDATLQEQSILDDEALRQEYAEDIPVVLVDGRVHSNWRVDADRLARALEQAGARA
ncbi:MULTISPECIES: glutaredoxin family protein [unclassified Curtobacterium]|uniref:glutaredoxin family protein n=1 Tax=unclassified Curtobacterium TaxID=257496 RepID=UPI0008DDB6D4|nr:MULTISPECIES: glutaredoxin family protein [unclassified Curtobacterium]OIH93136.1 thioredoxin [Curtobacterium sp. MCBA15_003]OII10627.1 thioredoxin [Curtobacterium sp. MCBA15_009]OII30047.1 thioredoxin [Curtobacterium sp. MMLR14_006]